jgi:hypothetical protein
VTLRQPASPAAEFDLPGIGKQSSETKAT